MQTSNLANENFEKLKALFPNAITETIDEEGNIVRAIDKDILSQEISTQVVEGREERYQFTWPDKRKAILNSNAPTSNTLRPCREESVNFDETENLYIEGDNLEVLKLLQETYLGKIKMIYIDPPYNTGNDFVYNDDFKTSTDEYLEQSGQYDEEGNRLEKNLESNGRFHTDWLNMMYPRLKLARNLLSDDGVIFISIDDNEQHNLRKMCDEIFGESAFITDIIWNSRKSVSNDAVVSLSHNYTLVYAKNIRVFYEKKSEFKLKDSGEGFLNPDNDPRGPWKADPFDSPGIRPNLTYKIKNPNTGEEYLPPEGRCWRTGKKEYLELLKENRIVFGKTGRSKPQLKRFYSEAEEKGLTPKSLWDDCGTTTDGTREIIEIFGGKIFDTPKPVKFIKKIIELASSKDSIVLDFFSGSATTADAVMQLNAEDGGNRKFIMVQLPEETDEGSEAYKAGYKNICEIGKERIRRAGKKIIEDNKDKEGIDKLDIGFRVLKTDSSNMKDVFYAPAQTEQSLLDMLSDNIKEDRSSEDLLFQVMLDLGISLSSKIDREIIDGKEVLIIEDGFLVACFDKDISDEIVKTIANKKPYYAVFRDSSMANDSVATNFEQIFDNISPQTVRKVI
ncbi:site-specific DNA-methyltransferase [Fastidiosipila sanguinis]|uniref:Site-specific DNA-methyltransferase n=2 Tax=Fastidiosipila sanguinis TaxID=236753 RepID=A0A2S0KQ72_9FIRM|nr:site-specific DNA-methyltransferase [Fastidiosipila sanguinis]